MGIVGKTDLLRLDALGRHFYLRRRRDIEVFGGVGRWPCLVC